MKATLISKENNIAKFTMEFTAEEFENAQIAAYKVNKDKFQVDGFRKGKAPRSIIEKMYGEGVFFEEAIDNMLNAGYPEAIDELKLEVIDRPEIAFDKIAKKEPVTITATVAVFPEVEVQGYKGVEIEKAEAPEVTEEDLQKELEAVQRRQSSMETVERAAELGDTVVLDYSGSVDDVKFEGGTAEMQTLELGSGMFIPGFEEQLVGVSAGESKDVKVTFPEEYHAPELAGKEAVFACTVHEVKTKVLPEITDDLIGDSTPFETIEEFKADRKKMMESGRKLEAEDKMRNDAMDKVMEANDIEVPEVMANDEVEQMVAEFNQQLMMQGLNLDTYLQYMGKAMEEFKAELKENAVLRAKSKILLKNIVRMEGITASEEEIDAEIKKLADAYGMGVEDVRKALGINSAAVIGSDICSKKAFDIVYDNAVVK